MASYKRKHLYEDISFDVKDRLTSRSDEIQG